MGKEPDNYFNPFPRFPLRLLWWIDNAIHNFHFCLKPLCDYLDDQLWVGTDEFFRD